MISLSNIFSPGAVLVLGIAALLTNGCATSPPVQEMSDARQAIAAAKEAGAEQYAAASLSQAELMLDTAEKYLQDGVYWQAKRDAIGAKEKAFEALLSSRQATGTPDGLATDATQ